MGTSFLDKLREQGIDEDSLHNLIQEESEAIAAEVNSSGLIEQVRFLAKRGYSISDLIQMFG